MVSDINLNTLPSDEKGVSKASVYDAQKPRLPRSIKHAILLPTYRTDSLAKSIIAAYAVAATSESAVLLADNSEDIEKHEFIKSLGSINSNFFYVLHEHNIGAQGNFKFLYEWSEEIEYFSIVADDDFSSPSYYTDAFQLLMGSPNATSASAGTTLIKWSNGSLSDGSCLSNTALSPAARIKNWDYLKPRITMYNVASRRASEPALAFLAKTPLNGSVLHESIIELARLSAGAFINQDGRGVYIHFPFHAEDKQRTVSMLCAEQGLVDLYYYISGLSTAVQCALFISSGASGISESEERDLAANIVFSQIFMKSFLPIVSNNRVTKELIELASSSEPALYGLRFFFDEAFLNRPVWSLAALDHFINLLLVMGIKSQDRAKQFAEFCEIYR